MFSPTLSCVIPAYNEAENLKVLVPQLAAALKELTPHHEIVLVDDGSRDATAAVIARLAQDYPVKGVLLARNFGKEAAITAGLTEAAGDAVILMDADLQHPVSMLPVFFAKWEEGHDMVYTVREDREDESLPKRAFTWCFYKMLKASARFPIEENAGDFRLMDRKVVEALKSLPERNRFMKGLYAWVGHKSIGIPYRAEERLHGSTSFNYLRLVRLAVDGLISFSDFPLRISAVLGFAIALLAIGYGTYELVRALIGKPDTEGWPTLVIAITFLSGIQLMAIGVLGEYVARIFNEVKGRPNYIVGARVGAGLSGDGNPA